MIYVGHPSIQLKLFLYLVVVAFEQYLLQFCCLNQQTIELLKNITHTKFAGSDLIRGYLPGGNVYTHCDDVLMEPMDLDTKENKLTYQKARLLVITVFFIINFFIELVIDIFWGPSDFEIT